MGTRSRAGVHGSFCSPAAVSRYPGAVVAGSARTRSTRADPAISGVSSSPSSFRYASSVWQLRAAYARTPRLPTSPNGVILGITAVTVMSSPARRDSSWAYPAMNRWVALDPAYPPLAGDPLMAAPLLTTTTLLPGGSGFSSASRSQVNAILTSVYQLTENVSHVWYWSGRITGLAPATRMRTSGSYWVQQAPRHRLIGRIRDLGPDVRAGGGQLGKRRAGPGDRDHRSTSLSERAIDPTPQAPASANDDSGPARQVTHNRPLPLRVHGFWPCRRLHRVPPFAYDLTGSAATSAAYWRSSALAALLRQLSAMDCDIGSGKMSSSPFSTPSKMARATDSGEAFGMSRPRDISVSTGPVRTA